MLIGLINAIFGIAKWLLNLASWVMIVYVVMSLVMPTHKYTLLARRYIERVLSPIRMLLARRFPKLSTLGFDLSPLIFLIALSLAKNILGFLQRILL